MTKKQNKRKHLNSFFSTKAFLVLMGFGFVVLSIYLWKSRETNNLAQLSLQTRARAVAYASEAEIRFRGIENALNRLANNGVPNQTQTEWEKDKVFYVDSFKGLNSIAWVDQSYIIQMIAPLSGHQVFLDKKPSEIKLEPSDLSLTIPVYQGTKLVGFIFGIIDIKAFAEPIIVDIEDDFLFQLSDEGVPIFRSTNWEDAQEGFTESSSIDLHGTNVLNLSLTPSKEQINFQLAQARNTLYLSLLFACLMIIAVYFAQNFNALSKLNAARFKELLEEVDLVAIMLDNDGLVTFCNDYLLELTGWEYDDVLGKDWFSRFLLPPWVDDKAHFLQTLQDGKIEAHGERLIQTRSGETRWLMFSDTLLKDTQGNIIGIASLSVDITERKYAETKIQELNAELEDRVVVFRLR